MDPVLGRRLAYALVGVEVDVGACDSEPVLLARLAADGWGVPEIRRHAQERSGAGQPWPHQVPLDWLRECGAARWAALVADLVDRLRLAGDPTVRSGDRPLTPDERRLLAEVPPHHGG